MPVPFAESGTKNTVPIPSQIGVTPGAASFTTGFPPLNFTPISAGGVPPFGADFNGVFNAITQALRWSNAGGQYVYDADFAAAVSGYPKGALLQRATLDGFWLNQTEGNSTDPDAGGAGWVVAFPAGIVGQASNLRMIVATASASATVTATELIVGTAIGGQTFRLASLSQTINLATTGAGGMDAGTAPASGFVALYAIYNPTTDAASILATNATSAIAPNVYGGANMPAGYTASALISVWATDASSRFVVGAQIDRSVSAPNSIVLSSSTATGGVVTALVTTGIPKNAKSVGGNLTISAVTASGLSLSVCAALSGVGQQINNSSIGSSSQNVTPFSKLAVTAPQTIYYVSSIISGSGPTFIISLNTYDF